jgi:hypothetical protein
MNPEMMLAQLAPLRVPPEIGWWPLAPGWWALLGIVLIAIALALRWYWRRHAARRYRRVALSELQLLRDNQGNVDALNRLLKAAALRAYPNQPVAALHGQSWLEFLCLTCPKLAIEELRDLEAPYQIDTPSISEKLFGAAECWLKRHEVMHA